MWTLKTLACSRHSARWLTSERATIFTSDCVVATAAGTALVPLPPHGI